MPLLFINYLNKDLFDSVKDIADDIVVVDSIIQRIIIE